MITQPEVYSLLGELDRLPGIMEPRLGRWCAWPAAKMQLIWTLMEPPQVNAERALPFHQKARSRVALYPKQWVRAARRPRTRRKDSGVIAAYQIPRIHRCFDGASRDLIYGDILKGNGFALPLVVFEQSWGSAEGTHSAPRWISIGINLAPRCWQWC